MTANKVRAKAEASLALSAHKYFPRLLNVWVTIYFAVTVLVLPMYMDREKYHAITAAKSMFFSTVSQGKRVGF